MNGISHSAIDASALPLQAGSKVDQFTGRFFRKLRRFAAICNVATSPADDVCHHNRAIYQKIELSCQLHRFLKSRLRTQLVQKSDYFIFVSC